MQVGREAGGESRVLAWRRRDARRRLRCIAGHLQGISGMLEAGSSRGAFDQIRAVRRAMNGVTLLLLEEHLETTAASSHDEWDDESLDRVWRETRDALFGVRAKGDDERGEALPLKEHACPSV